MSLHAEVDAWAPIPYARPLRVARRAALVGAAAASVGALLAFLLPRSGASSLAEWAVTAFIVVGLVLALGGGAVAWLLTVRAFGRGVRELRRDWRRHR